MAEVAQALEHSLLDPAALTLELTETVLIRDAETALTRLRELKSLGVRLAVDDFGTGYLFARPLPAEDVDGFLGRQVSTSPTGAHAAP